MQIQSGGKTCEHADIARRLKTQAHMSTCLQVVVVLIGCQRSIQIKKNCSHYTCPLPPTRPSPSRRHFSVSALHSPPSRQRSALRPRSSRGSSFTFRFPHVSFAIRPHQAVDAFNSARSISPSCAGPSAPSLRRIRLHRPLAYATIGSRQSSALQRFAERVLCIG